MKYNYTLTVLFLFFTFLARGQQTTNTAGDYLSNGNNGLTFSLGEEINDLFSLSGFTVKAGVIQCPVPAVFSFQQVINPCIPDGGGISLALSGSEANVRYELRLDGNPLVDSIVGTGNALNLLNASQAGIYSVRASYSGMSCFVDMPQQLVLKRSPTVSLASTSVSICAGQNTSIQLNAAEEVFVNFSVLGGTTQRKNISTNGLTIPISNASL